MTTVTLLVVVLSTQGYWLADRPGTIEIAWAAPSEAVDATLTWRLLHDKLELAGGHIAVNDAVTTNAVTPPVVRVRTRLVWRYQLHGRADQRLLSQGEHTIYLFPDTLLEGLAERITDPVLLIAEAEDPIVSVLRDAGLNIVLFAPSGPLPLPRVGNIVVTAQLRDNAHFLRHAILQAAQQGARVVVFSQHQTRTLLDYPLHVRPAPDRLVWRTEHPLLRGLSEADCQSWLHALGNEVLNAMALPVDEPALEIAYWPPEARSVEIGPIDALLVSKTVERGRVVLCQLPLGAWQNDPRSQLLLRNALDYLTIRPAPTPPPSRRVVDKQQTQAMPGVR